VAKLSERSRVVRGAVAVLAGLALVVGGVGAVLAVRTFDGGDVPRAASDQRTPGSSPSGLDRTASAAPTLGAEGRQRTAEGGEAFLRFWFATLDYAVRTGQVTGLEEISDSACVECQRALLSIRESYAAGGSLRGGAYTVRSVVPVGLAAGEQNSTLDVVFDRSPRSSVGQDGQPRGSLAGVSFVVSRVLLAWDGDGWKLLTLAASGPIA
jgi:hypothetical protein